MSTATLAPRFAPEKTTTREGKLCLSWVTADEWPAQMLETAAGLRLYVHGSLTREQASWLAGQLARYAETGALGED